MIKEKILNLIAMTKLIETLIQVLLPLLLPVIKRKKYLQSETVW